MLGVCVENSMLTFQKIILSTKYVVFSPDLYPYYFNILKENFVIVDLTF